MKMINTEKKNYFIPLRDLQESEWQQVNSNLKDYS